ncbi:MAG TPA: IS4 family transposase [Parapedobacter sp.]|uniref:IS4 family transposase n=1 Tax=Parapedobacter sp. TaxID=1958893 RepID=UPI002C74D3E1|nr:IS4 family transposase [Parapedobacter sp.]HWK55770.1 IS4 family transposase [Parapedobacter sp.]
MNQGKYVFAQVTSFLDPNDFLKCVKRYAGNYKIRQFTHWHQLMCLVFGQLCNRESLSDLVTCLDTQRGKWYHLGLGKSLSKSNLAYANANRDWRIFADYAYLLIEEARRVCIGQADFTLDISGNVYAVDSTTIDLCLGIFWWAKFRKRKAAVRLHTQLDIKTGIPNFIHMTDGTVHDVNFLDVMEIEAGSIYVLDRGYLDFQRLYRIHSSNAYFVTRLKNNTSFRRLYSRRTDRKTGVICDQTIRLNNYYAARDYPEMLRRIKYRDPETDKVFNFVTNNFELEPMEICQLYKYRWQIELFFKWVKQHLKIKAFWGHTENAVRIQVYTAIIAYLAVAIVKAKLAVARSNYEILQILSLTLIDKTPLNELLNSDVLQNIKEQKYKQLKMF